MQEKRIILKLLGAYMEVVNVTPEKFMSILNRVGLILI